MTLHEFIFSKNKRIRYVRHIAFWATRFFFLLTTAFAGLYFFQQATIRENIFKAIFYAFYIVSAEAIYTYAIVYWLIPQFFSTRKFLFATFFVILSALLVAAEAPIYIQWYMLENLPAFSFALIWECIALSTATSHLICILFIVGVLFRNYYFLMEERESLINENTQAEMKLLKSQIHPHFLFNTLNNIYSFALKKSAVSGELLLKLYDTLRYIVRECDIPRVPVGKELKFIEDYIGIEKVRYSNRLKLEYEVKGDIQDKWVAPLLLIPFVENAFKHGASRSLIQPWVKINISIENDFLSLHLTNSMPSEHARLGKKAALD